MGSRNLLLSQTYLKKIIVNSNRSLAVFFVVMQFWIVSINPLKLAIVGAGPAGLFLASRMLSTSTRFSEIDVIESKSDPRKLTNHTSFAIGMNPRIWNAFDLCSPELSEYLQEKSCQLITSTKFIRDFKKSNSGVSNGRFMSTQPLIASALINWIEQKSSTNGPCKVSVQFNTKCLAVDPISGLVYVAQDGRPDEIKIEHYDLIVGADGARSTVRQAVVQQSGVSCEKFHTTMRWKFIAAKIAAKNSSAFFNFNGVVGGWWTMPTGKAHLVCFWPPQTHNELMNPTFLKTIEDTNIFFSQVFGETPENISQLSSDFLETKPSNEYVFKLNRYHHESGKIVLVGDSAHVMSTALGQGMACALEDVNCLFENLKNSQWENFPIALQSYSNERVEEGNAITDLNFISVCRNQKLLGTIFTGVEMFRKFALKKKLLFEDLQDPAVKYSQILQRYSQWVKSGKKIVAKRIEKSKQSSQY